jgi:hypothetical protein
LKVLVLSRIEFGFQFPEEAAVPKVFPLGSSRKPAGAMSVVSDKEFQRNFFDVFTEGLLKCGWQSNTSFCVELRL